MRRTFSSQLPEPMLSGLACLNVELHWSTQGMYSERPAGRAMTVREAYSRGQHDAATAAAGSYDMAGGEAGGWGRPGSAGIGGWCAFVGA